MFQGPKTGNSCSVMQEETADGVRLDCRQAGFVGLMHLLMSRVRVPVCALQSFHSAWVQSHWATQLAWLVVQPFAFTSSVQSAVLVHWSPVGMTAQAAPP